jgi:type I restriction enzyme, S subunit
MSKKYQYCDTGLDWLGEVPDHWKLISLKNAFYVIPSNVDKKTEDDEDEVQLCNYVDVYYNDFITLSLDFMTATATEGEIKKFQLEIGDVLITKDSEDPFDIAVPALVKEIKEKLLCGYHLSLLRSSNKKVSGDYLFWTLKDEVIVTQLWREACGVTRWAIASRHIKNSIIPLPAKEEQTAIANYLDRTCADIDKVMEFKRKQIENLKNQLESDIYQLTTEGIKQSSFSICERDWIRRYPSHWKLERLKDVSELIETGSTPPTAITEYYEDGSIKWFGPSSFEANMYLKKPVKLVNKTAYDAGELKLFPDNSLFIVGIGATIGKVGLIDDVSSCNQQVNVFKTNKKVHPRYLYYFMRRYEFIICNIAQYTTLQIFNQTRMALLHVLIPPISEQEKIVALLDKKNDLANQVQLKIEEQIASLEEYKKALIHEVVTGKKQVHFRKTKPSKLKSELTAVV